MSNITMNGKVLDVSEHKIFKAKDKEFGYRTVILKIDDGFIAANYWQNDDLPKVGTHVSFVINVNSERNKKNQELFYHKINLQSIYESTGISQEV